MWASAECKAFAGCAWFLFGLISLCGAPPQELCKRAALRVVGWAIGILPLGRSLRDVVLVARLRRSLGGRGVEIGAALLAGIERGFRGRASSYADS